MEMNIDEAKKSWNQLVKVIYTENLILLKRLLTNRKFQQEIEALRRLNPSREKLLKDKFLQLKLNRLVNRILLETKLPKKLFTFYIVWYVLYDKFDAPFMNFLVNTTKDTVTIEFFRKPHTNDWKLAKLQVDFEFEKLSPSQRARIDPRLSKTIDRKIAIEKESQKRSNIYDIMDSVFGEDGYHDFIGGMSRDKQKRSTIRKDRERLKKLDKQLGVT